MTSLHMFTWLQLTGIHYIRALVKEDKTNKLILNRFCWRSKTSKMDTAVIGMLVGVLAMILAALFWVKSRSSSEESGGARRRPPPPNLQQAAPERVSCPWPCQLLKSIHLRRSFRWPGPEGIAEQDLGWGEPMFKQPQRMTAMKKLFQTNRGKSWKKLASRLVQHANVLKWWLI